jgi:hypothetical protein
MPDSLIWVTSPPITRSLSPGWCVCPAAPSTIDGGFLPLGVLIPGGYDCQECGWPEGDRRGAAEAEWLAAEAAGNRVAACKGRAGG